MEQVTLLTSKDVQNLCAISRSALYRLMKKKKFPLPVKIGERTQRWRSDDIQYWIKGLEYGLVEGFSGTGKKGTE
jgi:prophage regulatory protein